MLALRCVFFSFGSFRVKNTVDNFSGNSKLRTGRCYIKIAEFILIIHLGQIMHLRNFGAKFIFTSCLCLAACLVDVLTDETNLGQNLAEHRIYT